MIRDLHQDFDPEQPIRDEAGARAWTQLCMLRGYNWFREYQDRIEDVRNLGITDQQKDAWLEELRLLFRSIAVGEVRNDEVSPLGGLRLMTHLFRDLRTEAALVDITAVGAGHVEDDPKDPALRVGIAEALLECFPVRVATQPDRTTIPEVTNPVESRVREIMSAEDEAREQLFRSRIDLVAAILDQAEHFSRPRRRHAARRAAERVEELRQRYGLA